MANKYAKPVEKKSIVFSFHWIGERIPKFITLPYERKVKVSNMRNGTIILEDGSTGTYKRTRDNNKTNERAISVDLEIE